MCTITVRSTPSCSLPTSVLPSGSLCSSPKLIFILSVHSLRKVTLCFFESLSNICSNPGGSHEEEQTLLFKASDIPEFFSVSCSLSAPVYLPVIPYLGALFFFSLQVKSSMKFHVDRTPQRAPVLMGAYVNCTGMDPTKESHSSITSCLLC